LDLIITNEEISNKMTNIETLMISPVSDRNASIFHVPLITEFELDTKRKKERVSFHASYLYDKTNWNDFVAELERNLIDETGDVDIEAKDIKIHKAFSEAATKFIPKSKESLKRDDNFPEGIAKLLRARNFWGREFRKRRS
jgi:endonuclease IV